MSVNVGGKTLYLYKLGENDQPPTGSNPVELAFQAGRSMSTITEPKLNLLLILLVFLHLLLLLLLVHVSV